MERGRYPDEDESRLGRTVAAARDWGGNLLLLALFLAVGMPLSIAIINWVYGVPEHVVWFFETTRTDGWVFWIANATGGVNETPWWW